MIKNKKEYNFFVVLFKNKTKKKIINKFITFNKAKEFYNSMLKNQENIIFSKHYDDGVKSEYELSLMSKQDNVDETIYTKDLLGRTIKIEVQDDDFKIKLISPFLIEELIYDFSTKNKITVSELIKKYLEVPGLKLISKLNNKIVVQNDDNVLIFTLKNDSDSERFIDTMSNYFMENKKTDCILVKDTSIIQRKYLYDLLTQKGFPKNYLFRHSTTHPK
jgi:hypothetical protein